MSPDTPPARPQEASGSGSEPRRRTVLFAIAGIAVLAAALGIAGRMRAKTALRDETRRTAAPAVSVIQPERGASSEELILPGNVQAFTEAPIYARTSGYVKKWHFDIGARVRKGDRLADIESPEVDQQLDQARADLASAQANENLARTTSQRLQGLVATKAVSEQEADSAAGALAARRADTEAARANVRRLQQLVSFEKIEAPFDGVITARNTDVGQLVDAGSAGGPARELFRIATTDTLRVFVSVPQTQSASVVPGLPVDLTMAEHAGKRYPGRIARTANAIDPATRTLRVEVSLDNSSGEILPGAYAEVHLKLSSATPTLFLPVSALMFRSEGVRVATLAGGNKARLLPVTLGRDLGTKVEVTSGLSRESQVIDSPPDSLTDGQEVQVVKKGLPPEEAKGER
jgi:RND family efflux transporter MFP subunit